MSEKKNYSRRDFLKVVGASTGVAAAGCAQELPEKIIPYVVQPNEVIPGVSVWYSGNCTECSAGCGWIVRTREGRAVKVEGNTHHPVNRGALCAMGQSSLQAHYDPDRIREPLRREASKGFAPISWKDAVEQVATALTGVAADKEILLVTDRLSGSIVPLLEEFERASKKTFTHVEWDLLGRDTLDLAAEAAFGSGVTTHFDLSKADVLVSFGADFLETWISPVEFSRQWASRRAAGHGKTMSYFAHFEPRLSPTAANADRFFLTAPGAETALLGALLKSVLRNGAGRSLSAADRAQAEALTAGVDEAAAIKLAGVDAKAFEALAKKLAKAKTSLVLAGGTAASANGLENALLANVLNHVLGNVGESVILRETNRKAQNSFKQLTDLSEAVNSGKKKLGVVIFAGVNPAFALPAKSGFQAAVAKADLIVNFSTALDETAQISNVILPLSTNFESWSDGEAAPGVFNLNQPSMQPLYQTQSLGDSLMAIGLKIGMKFGDVKNFHDYMQSQWKKRLGDSDFQGKWLEVVEKGGEWGSAKTQSVSRSLASGLKVSATATAGKKLFAFATVNMGDGRGANRAWLHEIPNSMSTSVWGSWVELHPTTAKYYGVSRGDVVQIVTAAGSIEAPVLVTKYVHPDALAIPLGQGHTSYGRFGTGVGANPLAVLSGAPASGGVNFIVPLRETDSVGEFSVRKVSSSETLVTLQEADEQGPKRGIMRTIALGALATLGGHGIGDARLAESGFEKHGNDHGGDHGGEHGAAKGGEAHKPHHHDPLALGPQPEPKQMYKQMEHPLYRWGMTIDLSSCTGCSACITACYAENNVPVVGKDLCSRGREMSWLRLERYMDGPEERPVLGFLPMMCQHCTNAPCEPVCPVYATYHNEEGLNTMVYNRCVGTRYCANNCSYKVRRFNWFRYWWPEPLTWQLNPDVTVREVGIMEKCSFCVQRVIEAKNNAKNEGRLVRDGEVQTACAATCPTQAITFGNLLDHESAVYKKSQDGRAYKVLDQYINTQPAVSYLARVTNDTLEA